MKTEKIRRLLANLNNSLTEIEDSAVTLSDGFVVASNLVHDIDEDKIGTISAALFGLANTAAQQFEKDQAQYVLIRCNKNYIAMFRAGDNAELIVDFKDNANIDKILEQCIDSSKEIADLIEF